MVGPTNGTGPGATTPAACAAALRPLVQRAAQRALAGGAAAALDGADEWALRAASGAVRERGLGAEHLVLALKAAWRELPDAQRLPRHEADVALAGLVTRGIAAFYPPHDAPCTPAPPSGGAGT